MPGLTYAQSRTVDYEALLRGDPSAFADLSSACFEDGFFYLNLTGQESQSLLADWRQILKVIDEWFDKPLEEKMKHSHGTVKHGYTPVGSYTGVYNGTKDGNETIKVTDDAMKDPALVPEVINEHRELFERFAHESRGVTLHLLRAISSILGLSASEQRLEDMHRTGEPTSSCLNLIRYIKSPNDQYQGQNQHTDNGTLTFLLSEQAGLEVVSKDTGDWEPVLPKREHAIVNVADTLRFLSGKRFGSAVHRAIPVWQPGQTTRFVVGYFLRAEDAAVLKDAEGGPMTAQEWHDRKYVNYKASHDVQKGNAILLGSMDVSKAGTAGALFDLPEAPTGRKAAVAAG